MTEENRSDEGNASQHKAEAPSGTSQEPRIVSWIEKDGALQLSHRTQKYVEMQILAFAVAEDVLSPPCPHGETAIDEYIATSAIRIREAIVRGIRESAVDVPGDYVDELANRCASEAFAIRCCKEASKNGALSRRDLRQMPFYHTYKKYFNDHPSIAEAASEALAAADIADQLCRLARK